MITYIPLVVLVEEANLYTTSFPRIFNVFPSTRNSFSGALQGNSGEGLGC